MRKTAYFTLLAAICCNFWLFFIIFGCKILGLKNSATVKEMTNMRYEDEQAWLRPISEWQSIKLWQEFKGGFHSSDMLQRNARLVFQSKAQILQFRQISGWWKVWISLKLTESIGRPEPRSDDPQCHGPQISSKHKIQCKYPISVLSFEGKYFFQSGPTFLMITISPKKLIS